MRSANPVGILKRTRRLAVSSLERCAEVAVAGKTEVERQAAQVVVVAELIKRAGQPESQLVAIERDALNLLEHLGEIHRRDAHVRSDLRQSPTASQVGREYELRAVRQLLAPVTASRGVRSALPQCSTQQRH